jgi:hypothetical protein
MNIYPAVNPQPEETPAQPPKPKLDFGGAQRASAMNPKKNGGPGGGGGLNAAAAIANVMARR